MKLLDIIQVKNGLLADNASKDFCLKMVVWKDFLSGFALLLEMLEL